MPRAFRCGVAFWSGQAEPQRLCLGLTAPFALIAPMPERPFFSAQPIISLTDTASPSKPWTMPSPEVSDVTPRLRDGLFWRLPTHSWIDDRTLNENGARRCV